VHRAVRIGLPDSFGPVLDRLTCMSAQVPGCLVRRMSADQTSGRRGREFKSPPPDQDRGGFGADREPANIPPGGAQLRPGDLVRTLAELGAGDLAFHVEPGVVVPVEP
jgi:hypothetical protein